MKNKIAPIISCLLACFIFTSCLTDNVDTHSIDYTAEEYSTLERTLNLPLERDDYKVKLAHHLESAGSFPPFIDNAKATLGRVLFYDTQLSKTGETACNSCHHQELAFSDDKALSDGINGQKTKRNSLPLAAAANFSSSYETNSFNNTDIGSPFQSGAIGFFWDERVGSIMEQSAQTIQDDIEMGMDLVELSALLTQQEYYRILFRKAYGDEAISSNTILIALQEFLNAFVSTSSRFDEGMNATNNPALDFPNYTALENRGKQLFISNCSSCHSADMSSPSEVNLANNGLDLESSDEGVGGHNGEPAMVGVFKVPFLRNITLTAPYMHDGRFETLDEVLDHYSSNIQAHENLSAPLLNTSGQARKFNFTESDKEAFLAFFETLADHEFTSDPRFSDPFKR